MSELTIEEKKEELELAGYTGEWMYLGDYQAFVFSFPDGIEVSGGDKIESIKSAYRYLQEKQELEALRDFAKEVWTTFDEYPELKEGGDIDLYNAAGAWRFTKLAFKAKDLLGDK